MIPRTRGINDVRSLLDGWLSELPRSWLATTMTPGADPLQRPREECSPGVGVERSHAYVPQGMRGNERTAFGCPVPKGTGAAPGDAAPPSIRPPAADRLLS